MIMKEIRSLRSGIRRQFFCEAPVSQVDLEQQTYINNYKDLHILIWMALKAVQIL